jgi:serine/threonine protein kinase/tetratricopeptide (TPR) repeat protein
MSEPSHPSKGRPRELTGQVGKYEIKRLIGRGAMGQVFQAHDTVLERDVALKVMSPQIGDDPELKARFEREAKAAAKISHPNVVLVFDLGSLDDGSPYIAMELLEGQDLQKTMRQAPPMTLERKVAVIVQVLAGLAHAHERGIVHRDIKPANIFITRDDSVKIMDFGVAHLTASSMTGDGSVLGTADYMSPEQVQGGKVDGRSDLFSVGCMLFELITGRRPFQSDTLMAVFYKITHERPNFDLVPAGVEHDALLPILKKSLARDCDERYRSAAAFAVDLRDWLRAHATTASSENVLEALLDLEAPTHPPQPLTQAAGFTVVPAEEATTEGAAGRGHEGRRPARSRTGTTHIGPPPVTRLPPKRIRRRNPLPWIALAAAVTATVAGLGYVAWRRPAPAVTPPVPGPSPTPVEPTTPPTPEAAPSPPPPTVAPPPTFQEPRGVAAASVREAEDAFRSSRYDRAVEAAQEALREDPSNTGAQEILDKALSGQKAAARLRAAESALAEGDLAAAEREVRSARDLAPWDQSAVDLAQRVDAAKLEAERRTAEARRQRDARRIAQLVEEGTNALAARQYDAAIAAYDRALRLDPGNPAAATGKSNAVAARTMAETAASQAAAPEPPARGFVASGSVARRPAANPGNVPPGFEASPEVEVRQGTQAAALPGTLTFEFSPASPEPGDRYSVAAYLLNEGSQPIELDTMVVTTTIDGRKQQGRVAPSASVVAPHQRALVFQIRNEVWKRDTRSWEMEIVVFTSQRDTYRNTLTWK